MKDFDIMIGLTAFAIALIVGTFYLPILRNKQISQTIREDGPVSHLVKSGTPTMGGGIFIIASILALLINGIRDERLNIAVFAYICFGLIGFIDDALIISYKKNEGLKPSQKLIAQIVVALILIYLTSKYDYTWQMLIPFGKGATINFKYFHYPILLFVILGTVNSVNLTDGLDGLASQVSIVGLIAYAIVCNVLRIESMSNFALAIVGALLGFLYYNKYPAKIFMGDVGSLALGGVFASIAIMTSTVLFLPIFGFVFVVETLSVIIQVFYFKRTGKRFFKMSPLHHHFEGIGWPETKVVKVFTLVAIVVSLIGIIGIF